MNFVVLLLLIVTMVLIVKKHVKGLNIACKLLAVMPLIFLLEPILQVAFASSQMDRFHGNEVAGLPSPISLPHLLPLLHPPPLSSSLPPRYSITSWPRKTFFVAT